MNAPDLCRPFYHRRGSRIDVCKPILLSEGAGMPAELRARSCITRVSNLECLRIILGSRLVLATVKPDGIAVKRTGSGKAVTSPEPSWEL